MKSINTKKQNEADFRIPEERIAHMHGVAEYCYRHASDSFYKLDPNEMYILGLLHDVGYIGGKSHHEMFGGEMLRDLGYEDWKEVAMHGNLLTTMPFHNKKLLLLIEADMKIDIGGREVGYDRRLKSIAERHGDNSRAYELCRRNIEFLKGVGRL